jgi:hypothetical protein
MSGPFLLQPPVSVCHQSGDDAGTVASRNIQMSNRCANTAAIGDNRDGSDTVMRSCNSCMAARLAKRSFMFDSRNQIRSLAARFHMETQLLKEVGNIRG